MFMDINKKKFVIDFLIFIDFLIIAISGFVLWFIIPKGTGRGSWIFVHDWFSVLLKWSE